MEKSAAENGAGGGEDGEGGEPDKRELALPAVRHGVCHFVEEAGALGRPP